jgi:lysophospholipase L1-like esterase
VTSTRRTAARFAVPGIITAINLVASLGWLAVVDVFVFYLRPLFTVAALFACWTLIELWRSARREDATSPAEPPPWRRIVLYQVPICICLLILTCFEGAGQVLAYLWPAAGVRVNASVPVGTRERMVEYLADSPFVKFRRNARIRSQGSHGDATQFAYEWTTDSWGFKNPPETASRATVTAVALGDSFTEGTGVRTEDAWPAVLTRLGHPTYNFGVQGYAPSQLLGVMQQFTQRLRTEWVLIAYCSTSFFRNDALRDPERIRRREFAGGIGNLAMAEAGEVRTASRSVTLNLALAATNTMLRLAEGWRPWSSPRLVYPPFERYEAELAGYRQPKLSAQIVTRASAWTSTLEDFRTIAALARARGARPAIVFMPSRSHVYFERAFGTAQADDAVAAIERQQLSAFAHAEGIPWLDPTEALRQYVRDLPVGARPGQLPYLEIDSHMGPVGHNIVAAVVSDALFRAGNR